MNTGIHIVKMTIDWSGVHDGSGISVATRECGWVNEISRRVEKYYKIQDAAIHEHWRTVGYDPAITGNYPGGIVGRK